MKIAEIRVRVGRVRWVSYAAAVDECADSDALVGAARECAALQNALALAEWVGAGRSVTAKSVLRRPDIPQAGQALGLKLKGSARSAADLPELHLPWIAARAMGLLSISGGRAVAGPALANWGSATGTEVLEAWSRGLAAVLMETFVDDGDGTESLEIGRLALKVLATDQPPAGAELQMAIRHMVGNEDLELNADLVLYEIFYQGSRGAPMVTLELLAEFGAVAGQGEQWRITPLGRWALSRIGTPDFAMPEPVGGRISAEGICQLKIALRYVRPVCWRRILVPASDTLGDLHDVIQVAFAWDGDHLHAFTIGRRQYGDTSFDLEFDADEFDVTLATAFARARKPISYVYDFGDDWEHEIELERVVEPDPAATYPVCVDGRGASPVEDCIEDEPAWIPFDQAEINTHLAGSARGMRNIVDQ